MDWTHAFARRLGRVAYAGDGPLIVNASCTFFAPLTYPGKAEVRMFLGVPGRTSVESYYEIWMDGKKYADGAAKLVWVDMKTTRPVPLPESLQALLDVAETAPSPTPGHCAASATRGPCALPVTAPCRSTSTSTTARSRPEPARRRRWRRRKGSRLVRGERHDGESLRSAVADRARGRDHPR